MIKSHNEIEVKFEASEIDREDYVSWIIANCSPYKYESTRGLDVYYQRDNNILRHRYNASNNFQELTVKQRKTSHSLVDRTEVDLHLEKNTPQEVALFLKLTGWSPLFTLVKENDVFWINATSHKYNLDYSLVAAMYSVKLLNGKETKKYVEFEVEKGSKIGPPQAKEELKVWSKLFCDSFKLKNEPLNQSIYEIYAQEM